jgi:hypothetical protein
MIKKILIPSLLMLNSMFAQDGAINCMIIKDENSIICKYTQKREFEDRTIQVNWIDPTNNISRQRDMIVPAGHGSVYDFRYIKGRMLGKWTFQVIDNKQKYQTTFELN